MFDYELPLDRIAQRPAENRAAAKMLVARLRDDVLQILDSTINLLPDLLQPGDLVVLNDSRVLPCRFFGTKADSGAEIEVLLLKPEPGLGDEWQALAKPMKRLKIGTVVKLSASLEAEVLGRSGEADDRIQLRLRNVTRDERSILRCIEDEGSMPIPGYIRGGKADAADRTRYQTLHGKDSGSVAAPTAGLHFTPEIFEALAERGVNVCYVTLHVGVASFAPIRDLQTHQMPVEFYRIPLATAALIAETKKSGGKVLAVGTTTVRSLESAAREGVLGRTEELHPTKLFITPGFEFKVIDRMLTNFHQPKTTHLLLVSAFFGEQRVRRIYEHALEKDYRFLSYGDCMVLG